MARGKKSGTILSFELGTIVINGILIKCNNTSIGCLILLINNFYLEYLLQKCLR
jgi:hypothetical protein